MHPGILVHRTLGYRDCNNLMIWTCGKVLNCVLLLSKFCKSASKFFLQNIYLYYTKNAEFKM
jgi:hypothetical protein